MADTASIARYQEHDKKISAAVYVWTHAHARKAFATWHAYTLHKHEAQVRELLAIGGESWVQWCAAFNPYDVAVVCLVAARPLALL